MLQQQLQHKIDHKTKPIGSLGRLEKLALQIGELQQTLTPQLKQPTVVVFAGDHGIVREGVSAYPPEVTHQMVLNFLNGGAAINVFCRQHNLALHVVDAGVNFDFPLHPQLIMAKVGRGTANCLHEQAMTENQLEQCFSHGRSIVDRIAATGCNVIGFGEMGIGNTSAATLIMSALCQLPLEACIGRGTGLNDVQLKRKRAILEKAQQQHIQVTSARDVMQTFGGFEMAQICGAMLAAQEKGMLILVDGFIASTVFLVADQMNDQLRKHAVFCHQSAEQGHGRLLQHLQVEPLLQMDMRLGEGTGCAVAWPIVESAVRFLNEMASFESAGVTNTDQE
jgi:nicotinate-nucleotide--dimethylbenzimidazole phosphoribosyltransferase